MTSDATSESPSEKGYDQHIGSESLSEKASSIDLKLDRETNACLDPAPPSPHGDNDEDETNAKIVVGFDGPDDRTNPYNWSKTKKVYSVSAGMVLVINSTMGSSMPSGAIGTIADYFNVRSEELLVLPVSIFLIGYILGPLVFAPLSESYGRKKVMISTFVLFTLSVLACALAPDYASLIVFRLLAGIGASTPLSVIGGIFADLYNTPKARGVVMAAFLTMTIWGPLMGPLVSAYVSVSIGWRWVFWIELCFAGITWPLILSMPETYGPTILRSKARKLRKESGNENVIAPADLEEDDLWKIITIVLTRPIRMFLFEAMVLSTCIYLALAYGIFYIFFEAFNPIFRDIYGFSSGEVGLSFLSIGVGSFPATAAYLGWDWYLARARSSPSPPTWSKKEEYVRLPLACFGGPLLAIGMFWLGWSAQPTVPWVVPMMGAALFGTGYLCIFISLLNYIVDAYEIYAASAMGALSATRSTFGVVLPFAAVPMYDRLGVGWACSLLGFLSALMCLIPFVFIRYGKKLRENSKFCQEIKQTKLENAEKQEELMKRQRRDMERLRRYGQQA